MAAVTQSATQICIHGNGAKAAFDDICLFLRPPAWHAVTVDHADDADTHGSNHEADRRCHKSTRHEGCT